MRDDAVGREPNHMPPCGDHPPCSVERTHRLAAQARRNPRPSKSAAGSRRYDDYLMSSSLKLACVRTHPATTCGLPERSG